MNLQERYERLLYVAVVLDIHKHWEFGTFKDWPLCEVCRLYTELFEEDGCDTKEQRELLRMVVAHIGLR